MTWLPDLVILLSHLIWLPDIAHKPHPSNFTKSEFQLTSKRHHFRFTLDI